MASVRLIGDGSDSAVAVAALDHHTKHTEKEKEKNLLVLLSCFSVCIAMRAHEVVDVAAASLHFEQHCLLCSLALEEEKLNHSFNFTLLCAANFALWWGSPVHPHPRFLSFPFSAIDQDAREFHSKLTLMVYD